MRIATKSLWGQLAAALFAAAFLSAPLLAGHGKEMGRWDPDRKMEMMSKKLDLTEDQQAKMKALHEAFQAEMKALRDKHKADMKALLTEKQASKFEKMKIKMDEKMKKRRGKHGAKCDKECCMSKDVKEDKE